MMNNYYYGKSGKGDFSKDDLPHNRRELFRDTLRTRLSGLCRINLLYMLIFLPAMFVIFYFSSLFIDEVSARDMIQRNDYASYVEIYQQAGQEPVSEEQYNEYRESNQQFDYGAFLQTILYRMLIWLIPCIAITGPFTAGLSYVTRNWARDEHAFIWTDFKDAVKANWKQALILSCITSILPLAAYLGWEFYGQLARNNMIMFIPQVLVMLIAIIWALSITYMHPLAITYELKMKDVIRNGLLMGVARLPMSIGIRLLHCVPAIIGGVLIYFWSPWYGAMILFAWYALIGFSLSRFITASYTNAVFDRFINPRIEGAKVDQGIYKDEDDEKDESGEGETDN